MLSRAETSWMRGFPCRKAPCPLASWSLPGRVSLPICVNTAPRTLGLWGPAWGAMTSDPVSRLQVPSTWNFRPVGITTCGGKAPQLCITSLWASSGSTRSGCPRGRGLAWGSAADTPLSHQTGDIEIVNYKTKDRCQLKFLPYSYFSKEAARKVSRPPLSLGADQRGPGPTLVLHVHR